MQKIIGEEKSLTDLLVNKKYTVYYYQPILDFTHAT